MPLLKKKFKFELYNSTPISFFSFSLTFLKISIGKIFNSTSKFHITKSESSILNRCRSLKRDSKFSITFHELSLLDNLIKRGTPIFHRLTRHM